MVEVTPHGFEAHHAHTWFGARNAEDPSSQLQFYKLMLCDAQRSWTPGLQEAAALAADPHAPTDPTWPKYRNMRVR